MSWMPVLRALMNGSRPLTMTIPKMVARSVFGVEHEEVLPTTR